MIARLNLRVHVNHNAVCRYKSQQIPSIAAQSADGETVTVYRLGDHVDITRGPLMSSTWLLGRFDVTAVSRTIYNKGSTVQNVWLT